MRIKKKHNKTVSEPLINSEIIGEKDINEEKNIAN